MKLKRYQRPCLILFLRNQSDTRHNLHITFLCFNAEILLIYRCLPYFHAKNKKYTVFQKIYARIHRLLKELGSLNNNMIMLELQKKEIVLVLKYSIKNNQYFSKIRNLIKSVPHVTKLSDKIKITARNTIIWNFVNNT